ncbi:hypothetical protein HUN27_14570 [Agrobacterium tumefaciens]|nr:hypothetical protein [Agrobacterium tumefaciens]
MLSTIANPKIRNLIRGVLNSNDDRSSAETMANLRRMCSPGEAYEAGKFLRTSPLARRLTQLPDFPDLPQKPSTSVYLPTAPLVTELAFARVRVEHQRTTLIEFFDAVRVLNGAVFHRDHGQVVASIDAIRREFGYSIFMLNKVVSIKYLFGDNEDIQSAVQAYLVSYNSPRRDVVAVILEDVVDPTRSYAMTRKTVHGYIKQERFGPMVAAVLASNLCPILSTREEASAALQAHGINSIVDLQFFLWSREPFLAGLLDEAGRPHLSRAIPTDVAAAIALSAQDFDAGIFGEVGVENRAFDEFTLLQHSNGWLEYPEVRAHRFAVERAIGHRLDGEATARFVPGYVTETPVEEVTLRDLWEGEYVGEIEIGKIGPANGGYLHRVIGLMRIIDKGEQSFDYDGECLLSLLNKTLDVALLATSSELSSFLSARRRDSLYQYLRAALISDREETAIAGHMLRKTTQAVVLERFGSIVAFMEYLYQYGSHVGAHFSATCSEPFLVQLYDLFATANEVVEAHAQLLEAYGRIEGNNDAVDRAKALRLELKLSKVRDDIDDNRIYIDPLRFHQWLIEKLGDDLRAAIPLLAEWAQKVTTGDDLSNPITLLQKPDLRIAKILDTAYHEFCTNKFFGVDSYIGRRIRHGTLKGVMLTEVRSMLDDASVNFRSPDVANFFNNWYARYERLITSIGSDVLQLHTETKNKGGIVATISNKVPTARVAVVDIALALAQEAPVQKAVATIQEYCWRLLEVDLLKIRAEIERLRTETLMIDPAALPVTELNRASATDLARRLNECVQRKFATLSLWLTQPKNISPSATLSLLFNAVLVEVKEQLTDFQPILEITEESNLDLYGHRYHYVYDLLYVLVYNAGKHGKCDGRLSFDVTIDAGNNVTVRVGSDMKETDRVEEVTAKIRQAMEAEIENAFKVDVFSGIRKVRSLEAHLDEFKEFRATVDGRRVYFSATLALRM